MYIFGKFSGKTEQLGATCSILAENLPKMYILHCFFWIYEVYIFVCHACKCVVRLSGSEVYIYACVRACEYIYSVQGKDSLGHVTCKLEKYKTSVVWLTKPLWDQNPKVAEFRFFFFFVDFGWLNSGFFCMNHLFIVVFDLRSCP